MDPSTTEAIVSLTHNGAALTLLTPDPLALVISSDVVLHDRSMIYYVAGTDYTAGMRELVFDETRSSHPLGVAFWREGKWIAYLAPVEQTSEDAAAIWQQWKAWLVHHHEEHKAAISAELRNFESKGE